MAEDTTPHIDYESAAEQLRDELAEEFNVTADAKRCQIRISLRTDDLAKHPQPEVFGHVSIGEWELPTGFNIRKTGFQHMEDGVQFQVVCCPEGIDERT